MNDLLLNAKSSDGAAFTKRRCEKNVRAESNQAALFGVAAFWATNQEPRLPTLRRLPTEAARVESALGL